MDIRELPQTAELIGKGKQGSVYKLSSDRCVKIYADERHARMERRAYKLAKESAMIPKLYEAGDRYLVMEYVAGETLWNRLKRLGTLTEEDAKQILSMIREMKALGFARVDVALFHIRVREGQSWKMIDLVHAYTKRYRTPRVLFRGLARLGLLKSFMKHVRKMDAELYGNWHDKIAKRSKRHGSTPSIPS